MRDGWIELAARLPVRARQNTPNGVFTHGSSAQYNDGCLQFADGWIRAATQDTALSAESCWSIVATVLGCGLLLAPANPARADLPATAITDEQGYPQTPGGYDTVTWTDLTTSSYSIEMVNWDPGYQPAGNSDSSHSPVTTVIATGTSDVDGADCSYDVRDTIASYYQPGTLSGKSAYYVLRNRNLRKNGRLDIVYADPAPVKCYGWL